MCTKVALKKHLDMFPESFSIDELVDRLILIEKIEKAELQSERNEVIAEDELLKNMESWFK